MTDFDNMMTPEEKYMSRRLRFEYWLPLTALVILASFITLNYIAETPEDFVSEVEHFKYGSIGADSDNGIPYWIWQVLPELFPEHLPDPAAFNKLPEDQRLGLTGYQQFVFIVEDGRDRPIGFSKRRLVMDRVSNNCAVCHVSTVRADGDIDPKKIYGKRPEYAAGDNGRIIVLGMPANTVDLQAYFEFLFDCASDGRFTVDNVMA